ncbi:MAG: SDR family oxidoreductase [Rhodospirillaceae bacterium]|jgi:3-oxoacyl-[acyl-carrier protein] reductase|nr:SDR family oxidoreductase [Rhodospirillaceae bacterium]
MNITFDNQLAVVTGAAQGIGKAIATGLRDAGAKVHLLDIDADGVAATAAELGASFTALDLGDREAVAAAVSGIETEHGAIDILASAAGGVRGQVGRPIAEVSEADWRSVFAANVDAAFWLAQAVGPGMTARGRGRIVYIASGAGLRPSLTGIQAYSSAKHALVGLTKQLSWEFAPSGVTVNAVAPGFVLSNPSTIKQWESYGPEGQKRLVDGLHTKRLGTADDIAAAVLFLASDAAGWITGQILSVDGGRS